MNILFCRMLAIFVIVGLLFSGCARNMSSSVYTSSAPVGKVLEGTLISARAVIIKDTDRLDQNGLGMIGGGIIGGLVGSNVGKGKGNALATGGAAMAGAAAGSYIQDHLSTSEGMEYVVRLDKKYIKEAAIMKEKQQIMMGQQSVDDEVKGSISVADTTTDLLSVVQGNDVIMQPGQRVLIIYNNDRPRVVPSY